MAKKKPARKKKYVNLAEQQRQQEKQYEKVFMDKLRNLCIQIEDVSLYHAIPPEEKILIYWFRGAPLKVVAAPGTKIQKRLMDALVKTIKSQQLLMTLKVTKDSGQRMTFVDYSIVGMPLEYHASQSDVDYPDKSRFAKYAELREEREQAYEDGILNICHFACWVFDDLEKKYLHTYQFVTETPGIDSGYQVPKAPEGDFRAFQKRWNELLKQDFRMFQKITIGTYPLEVRKVNIDGETHSAIQTGAMYCTSNQSHFIPFTVSPDDLHLDIPSATLTLPVYIQRHALTRMKERLGITIPGFYKIVLMQALLQKEFTPIGKNRLLMACFTDNLKIGYFVVEVVEDLLLIRTFLLLTNSGTPEGNRLSQLTGLQTDDRRYLSIDTLQGLVNSDIEQNEAFCNLLRTAGCGSILELCRKINNVPNMMWLLDKSHPKNIISDLITEYLKPTAGEEEYVSEA
ncbi:MAG: hypothetical protein LBT49_02440 [Prevotellaceae bacterium]|jgi:hypothetical protein|nr:hypothetical protein [Prevotellaceae bacterium]